MFLKFSTLDAPPKLISFSGKVCGQVSLPPMDAWFKSLGSICWSGRYVDRVIDLNRECYLDILRTPADIQTKEPEHKFEYPAASFLGSAIHLTPELDDIFDDMPLALRKLPGTIHNQETSSFANLV